MKIDTDTISLLIISIFVFIIVIGNIYLIYLAFNPIIPSEPILPKPDKIVVATKIDASVTQAIMDVIKEECFGANVLSIEFMGEESFSLICKIDRKASRRKKK